MLEKIVKRDGRIVPFNKDKIAFAVLQAAIAVGGRDNEEAEKVADEVIKMLSRKKYGNSYPTVEEIQDMVEKVLIERGHAKTAKAYIVYRYEHALKRQGQKSLTYSSENIPYRKLWQALSWAVDKKCVTLSQIAEYVDRRMDSERGFTALIKESEAFYKSQLEEVEKRILDDIERIKIIIIAGPSSSGKTTTTIKITEGLKKSADVGFVPLNVDNYFLDLDDQPKDTTGDYDYETPQALDLELIRKHLNALINGEEVPVPKYNFKTGKREGVLEKLKLKSNDIILIDSLHGMFPGIMEGIDDTKKFKLYIETLSQVKDENLRFIKWADIRMLRRMVRDMQFRNYSPEKTLTHWHLVRRSELRYIISRLRDANAIVNSFLPYELPVMKKRIGALFPGFVEKYKNNPERDDAFTRAERVLRLFKEIPQWNNEDAIPQDSLLREFIGGSIYKY
ncbi:MAG: hypothetical protein J7K04_15020 [Spirochaetales bacterium]|nr:hypothetical protein [Spirochaetales bacterium]